MSLVPLIYWIEVTSASSYVFIKLIPLSLHVWSITPAEFWWDDISSLALLSSIFSSLILVLDSVAVSFYKVTSSFDERLVWTLIQGMFELPITLYLLYVFRPFYLLLLTYEVTVVHLLFLYLKKNLLTMFLFWRRKRHDYFFTFVK